jgi:hypothetical protein
VKICVYDIKSPNLVKNWCVPNNVIERPDRVIADRTLRWKGWMSSCMLKEPFGGKAGCLHAMLIAEPENP